MFLDALPPAPPDPILGLAAAFDCDPAPNKVDLGIGIYRDEEGRSQVLASVKQAEQWLLQHQTTKSYLSSLGQPEFNDALQGLLFGAQSPTVLAGRVRTIQTPGGSGALRIGAELVHRCRSGATVWIPNPTWANHGPILRAAGLAVREYRYYDSAARSLRYADMLADLSSVASGDVVLVHGCCHNPSGADLEPAQWRDVAELIGRRNAIAFIDLAYQGFAVGIDADAAALRMLCEQLPVTMVASSCSKNFSLYRERTGALSVVARNSVDADRAAANALQIVRTLYSMPPDHGAAVVAQILRTPELHSLWSNEVAAMRARIQSMRAHLAEALASAGAGDFSYLREQHGMFSFLNVSREQVARLREEFHVHLIDSGRINVAALSTSNVERVAAAVAAVL